MPGWTMAAISAYSAIRGSQTNRPRQNMMTLHQLHRMREAGEELTTFGRQAIRGELPPLIESMLEKIPERRKRFVQGQLDGVGSATRKALDPLASVGFLKSGRSQEVVSRIAKKLNIFLSEQDLADIQQKLKLRMQMVGTGVAIKTTLATNQPANQNLLLPRNAPGGSTTAQAIGGAAEGFADVIAQRERQKSLNDQIADQKITRDLYFQYLSGAGGGGSAKSPARSPN